MLCGLSQPMFEPVPQDDDPCKDLPKIAYNAAMEKYELYLDSLRNVFDTAYYNKCMKANDLESFTVSYKASEYHYTLYYYDQAGNLVKTVPPAGVDAKHADATFLANVKTKRQNVRTGGAESSNILTPTHTLETEYRYNTLNQVIAQKTPDAGESKFWYDRLGRLVVSQNAKQYANARYSYTLYDELGRISQVGQKPQSTTMTETISRDPSQLATWLANNGASSNVQNKEEITRTVYDVSYFNGEATLSPAPLVQQHLRNRVSYTQVFDTEPSGSDDTKYAGTHRAATYYSYDIHGNVDTLLQDYNSGIMASTGNRYKKMVYDYDLISGKVNQVAYQPGFTDEFYHRYTYDAENRVTDVETSHDGWIWEKDARYSYYKHGSLARTILGQQQVQGLDYAYTLQGWLKGVNSTTVNDGTYDMGGDGKTGAGLNLVARDAFGFSLNYFSSDYKPIGGTSAFAAITAPTPITVSGQELFNGNIGAMAVNIPKLGDAHLYRYRYDQLNRIVAMDAFTGLNSSTNAWTPSATDNYKERVSYDPNGNILTYLRNGTTAGGNPQSMDNLTYGYNLSSGKLVNNRLRHVKDAVSSGNYTVDVDNQSDDNYTYDAIGNLTGDAAEGISSISWNTYGKIASIAKSGSTISYSYDVAGNRVTKTVTTGGTTKTTIYVRDASGNVMSLYEQATSSDHLMQEETHLYGSSRLGIFNVKRDVNSITQIDHLDNIATFIRGNKFFELGNHLGNVLATVADTKTETDGNADGVVDYYSANVISANDYYPFGMIMPGRNYKADNSYRYGFNGKESDNEVDGEGNQYDYGFRIYNPRLGRFLSVDPLSDEFPWYSPYHFSGNNPVQNIDMDGLEETHYIFVWTDNPEKPVIKLAAWQVGEQTGEINQDGTLEYGRPFSIVAHYPIERGDEVYFVTATYDSEEAFKNAKAKDFTLSIISLGALLGVEAADDYMDKVTMLIGLGSFKKSVKLAVKEAVDAANTLAIKEVKQLNKQVVDKLEKKIVKDASEKAGEEAVKQELKQVKQSSKGAGRAGKQAKLKEVAEDQKQPNHIRGWIQQEQNSIKRGRRKSIRNPPGYDMAHKRGYEAKKGNGYDKSHPQLRRLHKLQHKFDNKGKKNKAGAIKL